MFDEDSVAMAGDLIGSLRLIMRMAYPKETRRHLESKFV